MSGDKLVKPWSIRRRLSRRVIGLVIAVWIAAIALTAVYLNHEINEMLDQELHTIAETTADYVEALPGGLVGRSVSSDPGNTARLLRIRQIGDPDPGAPWPVISADGMHQFEGWRVLRVTTRHAVIEVAHSNAWRKEEIIEASLAFLILIPPMLVLLILGLRYTVRQGFVPLDRMSSGFAARPPEDLSPLSDKDLPLELQPLAHGLNAYIARIGELREAERAFIANASHELRTPIAAIRARLDLSQDAEARAVLPMLDALTRWVERLLQLSRSEAGLGAGSGQSDLVRILRLLLRDRAAGPAIHFDDGDHEQMLIVADPDALAILLRNLIENAVEHGTGEVRIRLFPDARLVIENPTTGLEFHDRPFEKRPGSTGSGLGLAIVAQLAAAMGAGISKEIRDGTARVSLRLPAA